MKLGVKCYNNMSIRFENVYKLYKSKGADKIQALDNFCLEIKDNEVFAIAGVNGAGKTTALKALFGLIKIDKGSVVIENQEKTSIGFAPEIPDLPEYMSVYEVLELSCNLAGISPSQSEIDATLKLFELTELSHRQVSTLSKGNRQRLSLAAAVVFSPSIIVFDEPTSGLDPLGRKLIKEVIKHLKKQGKTLIFSTHFLADLPELCDKMAIVNNGKIVFSGTVKDFSENTDLEALEKRFSEICCPTQNDKIAGKENE